MIFFLLLYICCLPYTAESGEIFTENQIKVILSLTDHFGASFCGILDEDKQADVALTVKKLSLFNKKNLIVSWFNSSTTSDFLLGNGGLSKYGGRPMIAVNVRSKTLKILAEISDAVSLSSVIWVSFSEIPLDVDTFQGIYIPFDCEFLYMSENETVISIIEIYQIEKNSTVESYDLGYWSEENGLELVDLNFYRRRGNLKGHTLTGIIKNNPPYVFVEKDEEGNLRFGGYLYEVWSELEFRLNFTTHFPLNYFDKNPQHVLHSKEVEFAIARISNELSAFHYMDFSQPIDEAKFYMFGHRPGSELDWDSYLKPFSPNTWFVNLVWMLFSSIALAVLYKVAWDFGTSEREANYFIFNFSESLLTVFRAICMQGSDVTPRSNSCRLLFLSIYLTALVVTSAFSAALFSLLTIPKPRFPFSSLDEVLTNRRYKLSLPTDPDFHKLVEDFSETLPLSLQLQIFDKLIESRETLPMTVQEGLEKLCEDRAYVLIFDLPNVLHLMQNMTRSCQDKILPSGPPLFTKYIGFAFKKQSPYKKLIDFHLIRMKNEGILNRLLLNFWPPQIPTVQATWVRVTLADISPILYMFGLGAVFGLILLYSEKAILHLRKKRTRLKSSALSNRLLFNQELVLSNLSKSRALKNWEMFISRRVDQGLIKVN